MLALINVDCYVPGGLLSRFIDFYRLLSTGVHFSRTKSTIYFVLLWLLLPSTPWSCHTHALHYPILFRRSTVTVVTEEVKKPEV